MRSFFDLVGFEYKKIWKRKSAVLALVIVAAAVCVMPALSLMGTSYVDGAPSESHYQAMLKDREYAKALSGRPADEALLAEANAAYAKADATYVELSVNDRAAALAEHERYARPYLAIYKFTNAIFNSDSQKLGSLTAEDMRDFYAIRHEKVSAEVRKMNISEAAKEKLFRLDGEIETPFVFAWVGGYDMFFGCLHTIGIVGIFALAVCLAPMFAGEYSARTDQLLLASKLGKSKLVSAKMFTAFTLSAAFFFLLTALAGVSTMLIHGFEGGGSAVQLLVPFYVYPMTVAEATAVFLICVFFATLFTVAIVLLLSSKFKSPFGVIIVVSVLLFVPMMINVSENNVLLYNLFSLLPSNMAASWSVFSPVPYELFGTAVWPYIFLPVFAALASAALLPFARRAFRTHQIG